MPDFPKSTWRLVITSPARGAWNMAVDEAVLESVGRGESAPTLRLFAWEPACLSIGYAQPMADADMARLTGFGWEVVRRPTGGRAILHTDELTYSVIAPHGEPRVVGDVLQSYRRLSSGLVRALEILAVSVELQSQTFRMNGQNPEPICFEIPSNYEITVVGKKLVGSAQARRKEGVLQHGTLPLYGDIGRIAEALAYPTETARQEAKARVQTRAATLEEALGRRVEWAQAADAFAAGFSEALNLSLVTSELSEREQARAKELEENKYTHPEWMGKV